MTEPQFNEKAYDEAREALSYKSTDRLESVRSLADTPAKLRALDDEIAERARRS